MYRYLSSSCSSFSSSEDEPQVRRQRVVLERRNLFNEYDDVDFKVRFRLTKQQFQQVFRLIEHDLKPISYRNKPISAENQFLIALRFYASGSFGICVGDNFKVSKPTVSRIMKKVSHYIASLRPMFVTMPTTRNEIIETHQQFYNLSPIARVIGALDCTHIKIQSPGGDDVELFRNRKGWFSINVQAVCTAQLKFLDVFTRWPGITHDATILNDSILRARFENNEFPDSYLLGDSGYPCRNYLLIPLLNPPTAAEHAYNQAHVRTRNTIERAFGVLKRRFPCLALGLRLKLDTLAVIVACIVLHNICDDTPPDDKLIQPEENNNPAPPQQHTENTAARTALINTIFRIQL